MEATDDRQIGSDAADTPERVLALASKTLASSINPHELLDGLVEIVVPALADCCYWIVQRDDGSLTPMAVYNRDPQKLALLQARTNITFPLAAGAKHPVARLFAIGAPVLVKAFQPSHLALEERNESLLELLEAIAVGSFMVLPLKARGRQVGLLCLARERSRKPFTDADLALAEELALRAAIALDNARLIQEAQHHQQIAEAAADRMARLQRFTAALSEALTLDRVAEAIVRHGADALRAVGGIVYQLDVPGHALRLQASTNIPATRLRPWQSLPLSAVLPATEVVRTQEPLIISSLAQLHLAFPQIGVADVQNAASVVWPLVVDDRVLGVVVWIFPVGREIHGGERTFLQALAQQGAQAMERARLYEAERAARADAERVGGRLALLAEASRQLSASLDYQANLAQTAELLLHDLADGCVLSLFNEQRYEHLVVRHADAAKQSALQALMAMSLSPSRLPADPLSAAVVSGQSYCLETVPPGFFGSLTSDARILALLTVVACQSVLIVPVRAHDHVLGALILLADSAEHGYRMAEVALAEELGCRIGLALANAMLFEEGQQALDARQQALLRAQQAQAAAEAAQASFAFLARAGQALSESLDFERTVDNLLDLVVPALAAGCAVSLIDEAAMVRVLSVRHQDPEKERLLGEMLAQLPLAGNPVIEVLAGCDRYASIPSEEKYWRPVARDEAHLAALVATTFGEILSLPLRLQGRLIGVLSVEAGAAGFSESDQALLVALAERAALAIGNALLFDQVQAADRRKADFLAMLGHELRNPIGAISNAVHVLQAMPRPQPEVLSQQAIIQRQVQHLSRLVSDLLDMGRINSGKIQLLCAPVDLGDVVRNSLDSLQALYEGRSRNVTCDAVAEPLWVYGDWVRLTQVVVNLLDNACKYSDADGPVRLYVGKDGDRAVLRVCDQGLGLAPAELETIFEPFTQSPASSGRVAEGLGLGLTLVRHLVGLHGGTVRATSPGRGLGSEFVVELPLMAAPETAPPPPAFAPATAQPPRSGRVLIIEDHRDAGTTLVELLRLLSFEADLAMDGPSGVDKALASSPDTVLVDIGLPGFDGYEVARRIRRAFGQGIRLVALTGFGLPEDRSRALAAGFDAHLTKPVDIEELIRLLAASAT